jgi:hypothetical protein
VQIHSTGKITSTNNRGIAGQATTGSVTINNKSYIRSATNTSGTPTGTTTNIGIEGLTTGTGATAAVNITNNANITAFAQGILARTTGTTTSGAITISSTGDITSVSTTATNLTYCASGISSILSDALMRAEN